MDPLSQVLALLRPREVGWRVIEAHDAWTLRFPARPDTVVFGQLIAGSCEVRREDGRALDLAAGDFLLMASPPTWSMQVGRGGLTADLKSVLADPDLLKVGGEAQVITSFIAGYFDFAAVGADLLARLMLPIVHVRGKEVAARRLGTLLSLLGDEAVSDRTGRAHMLERLLELILVEALRQPGLGWSQAEPGLLKGLAEPRISRALHLMHESAPGVWTVADLARAAGMSRSSFAARFTSVVGLPPMDYLSSWRMTLARQALEARDRPMAEVAELAGYQSVSAFSTAFRRQTGLSPTAHLRATKRPGAAAPGVG